MANSSAPWGVVVLAAGMGKRMRSSLPKVLHETGGQPLLFHILDRISEVSAQSPIAIVVGHGREKVESAVKSHVPYSKLRITFIHQVEQKGTGHAARCAMDSAWGKELVKSKAPVMILPGDLPLIPASLVRELSQPLARLAALRLLTCELANPQGYGRVVRRGKRGGVLRIVEEKDANVREKEIKEVAASSYLFQSAFLAAGLTRISNKNAQGEFYLTDLIGQAVTSKKPIDVLLWENDQDLRGVNDPWELAQAQKITNERCIEHWSREGVRFSNPWSTQIDSRVVLAPEAEIQANVHLAGNTKIAARAVIGQGAVLKNVKVGESAQVKVGTIAEDSVIGANAQVGPYAHLRPGSMVGDHSKIGNFVELKKTKIGHHTSVAHLSYLGDAEVGDRVNIGCGFVTCNFDGRVIEGSRKHKTVIEDDVFLGSDCQVIAPIRIGKNSYIASGSTITHDVESGALAIARSKQTNKQGYAHRIRAKIETEA
jgi:bifunctional UDP-N-acetylglucosamine pyrophosphorylase/glucosamine-1-phosphate N-acetyltransferase